jgi:hypothetical protein
MFTAPYSFLDSKNQESNPARITVNKSVKAMPWAADCLVAVPVPSNGQVAVDVLEKGTSFFKKDEKSVVLLGIKDVDQDFPSARQALLRNDGKSLRVPGEGVWLVDDNGLIAYQALKGVTRPPTAVTYRFSDVQGNQSNPGVIVINPAVTQITDVPTQMAAQDDDTFWTNFQDVLTKNKILTDPFIAMNTLLGNVVQTLGPVGSELVSVDDFNAAYAGWLKSRNHLHPWFDPATSTGLFTVCAELVNSVIPQSGVVQGDYRARYWRLNYMALMAARLKS